MAKEKKYIRVKHPNNDGTFVEFRGMSIRQIQVLKAYKLISKYVFSQLKVRRRYLDE